MIESCESIQIKILENWLLDNLWLHAEHLGWILNNLQHFVREDFQIMCLEFKYSHSNFPRWKVRSAYVRSSDPTVRNVKPGHWLPQLPTKPESRMLWAITGSLTTQKQAIHVQHDSFIYIAEKLWWTQVWSCT